VIGLMLIDSVVSELEQSEGEGDGLNANGH
jgi:hypothetical protein